MSKTSIHAAYKTLLTNGRLTTNPGQAALVNRLAKLQDNLVEFPDEPQNGVYIYGSVGTGKSRIADLFAHTMPSGISKRRIHFYEFMMDIHSRLHVARSQSTYRGDPLVEIGRKVREESKILCFDEFQVTDIADAMILKRLFGAIWNAGGVMVATSNRHPNMLYEKGLNRSLFLPFIAELQQRCEVWKLEGEQDYRMTMALGEAESENIFFIDQHAFQQSLAEATNNAPFQPLEIQVMMSRKLHVEGIKSKNDQLIVHGTFKSLCEANLGSMDYYALCKTAKTIYLSGLRKFRVDELDFVRRFITLIDLAYESKTRVICLSEVPLLEVFTNIVAGMDVKKAMEDMTVRGEGGSSSSMMSTFIGETEWSATGLEKASLASGGAGETDVRFAVGRAISRLHEMGSKAYGVLD